MKYNTNKRKIKNLGKDHIATILTQLINQRLTPYENI
jgi:hypothetical protein